MPREKLMEKLKKLLATDAKRKNGDKIILASKIASKSEDDLH